VWEEEYPTPGFQSVTERFVTWQIIGLGLASTWFLGGDFAAGYAICGAIGAITVFFYFFLGQEPIVPTSERRAYLLRWSLAPLALFVIWVAGQASPTIGEIEIGQSVFLTPSPADHPWPVTGIAGNNAIYLLAHCFLLLCSIGIVATLVSRHAVAHILWTLFINAMVLAAIGGISVIMRWDKILGTLTPPQQHFFAIFPAAHQWSAFGLFWVIVGFGIIFNLKQNLKLTRLLEHNGGWLVGGWILLIWSVYHTGAPIHRFLLGLTLGTLITLVGLTLIRRSGRSFVSVLGGAVGATIGLAVLGFSIVYLFQQVVAAQTDPDHTILGIPIKVQAALWRDAWALFLERPLFGWGAGSFPEVFSLRQQIDLGSQRYVSPHSDLLRALVEFGVVGVSIWLAYPVSIALAFTRLRAPGKISRYLWAAIAVLGLLAMVSQPLSSPANLVCLLVAIPAAYKWAEAPITKTGALNPLIDRNRGRRR